MQSTLKATDDEISAEVRRRLTENTLESLFAAVGMNKPHVARRILNLGDSFGYEAYEGMRRGSLPDGSPTAAPSVDPNGTNEAGATPLHMAAVKGYTDIGRMLCAAGANPNATFQGNAPLHLAVSEGCSEFCAMLLQHGARINDRDAFGFTPLHLAAVRNNRLLANLLIGAGADPSLVDGDGKTVAQRWNFNAVNPASRPFLAPNEGFDPNPPSSSARTGAGGPSSSRGGGGGSGSAMAAGGQMDAGVVDKVLLARFRTFKSFTEERRVEVLPEGVAAMRYDRSIDTAELKRFFLSLDAMGAPPDVHSRQIDDMLCDAMKIRGARAVLPERISFESFCVVWLKAHAKGLIP